MRESVNFNHDTGVPQGESNESFDNSPRHLRNENPEWGWDDNPINREILAQRYNQSVDITDDFTSSNVSQVDIDTRNISGNRELTGDTLRPDSPTLPHDGTEAIDLTEVLSHIV